MKKAIIAIAICVCFCVSAFSAVNAVFKDVTGKVEVNDGKGWKPAKAGLTVSKGSIISTGFKSQATLDIGPSVLFVKPLSRMKLEELIEKEGIIQTELFLDVGRVTAEVKTSEGMKNDFRIRSPVSTAAVRGSTVDFSGENILLINGKASGINALGQSILLHEGDDLVFEDMYDLPGGKGSRDKGCTINPHTFDDKDVVGIGGSRSTTIIVVILSW